MKRTKKKHNVRKIDYFNSNWIKVKYETDCKQRSTRIAMNVTSPKTITNIHQILTKMPISKSGQVYDSNFETFRRTFQ